MLVHLYWAGSITELSVADNGHGWAAMLSQQIKVCSVPDKPGTKSNRALAANPYQATGAHSHERQHSAGCGSATTRHANLETRSGAEMPVVRHAPIQTAGPHD